MNYLVTGATGFIGRFLVPRLLERGGDIHVLVRPGLDSADRFHCCVREWDAEGRVHPVHGDLGTTGLGIDRDWLVDHRGRIDHFFHLAGGFDTSTRGGFCEGTRNVLDVARRLNAGTLHHLSTVDVAGDHEGVFTEDMFDEGQTLATPAQRARFQAERMVRRYEKPWRIYRPSIVVGHSRTGEIDRIDGPYYFFKLLRMAAQLPRLLPVLVPQLGETNMVPVDFVAHALDHLAHADLPPSTTYHLVDPHPRGAAEALNLFADEAGAPHLVEVMPARTLDLLLRLPGARRLLTRAGMPRDILAHSEFTCRFDCRHTSAALAGSEVDVPPLDAYAPLIWKFWSENWV